MIEEIKNKSALLDQHIWTKYTFDKENLGLPAGELGLMNYCLYCYENSNSEVHLGRAFGILENIIELINQDNCSLLSSSALADGIIGLGLILDKCKRKDYIDSSFDEYLLTIDELVAKSCQAFIDKGNFDYMWGAFGLIDYLYKRKTKSSIKHLQSLMQSIEKKLIIDDKGIRFYNIATNNYTRGTVASLSHGMIGFMIVLLKLRNLGLPSLTTLSNKIIYSCTDYIISNSTWSNYSNCSYFVHRVNETKADIDLAGKEKEFGNRLAWCTGDLNMLFWLYKLNKTDNNDKYKELADAVGLKTCERYDLGNTGVQDAHFCHGASGVAHMYRKIYQLSGETIYEQAHKKWLNRTNEYLTSDHTAYDVTSVMEGIPGINLTLLSIIHNNDDWDSVFLLD